MVRVLLLLLLRRGVEAEVGIRIGVDIFHDGEMRRNGTDLALGTC